jgi:hypothetical protein
MKAASESSAGWAIACSGLEAQLVERDLEQAVALVRAVLAKPLPWGALPLEGWASFVVPARHSDEVFAEHEHMFGKPRLATASPSWHALGGEQAERTLLALRDCLRGNVTTIYSCGSYCPRRET